MKAIPTIEKYMTTTPRTISADISLAKAEKVMNELQVRHLPVLEGGRLVGILSDRDIKLVESFKDVNPEKVAVREAFTEEPYTVSPKASLSEVCSEMAAHKYGSVLVTDNHKLVGIFTWVDALDAMRELLETRLKH
ncbi:MAG TPA: CBS domain-containing protein [Bdellovibrio sp.]|uniref:CBS domain-containing protein n=1 Tax=Bdellovibrio sp. TaxID=28201 RepID=UPI002EF531FB